MSFVPPRRKLSCGDVPTRREEVMKILRWIIAVAGVAFVLPAHAATTDPIQIIYRMWGVLNAPPAATVINCTNLSAVPEIVRVVVRGETGVVRANAELPVATFVIVTF